MEQAYGAGKAGGVFDPVSFIQQPQPILRFVSWIFSLVVFGCIANEGYMNRPEEEEEFCIFNSNQNACNYGVAIGSLAFLICLGFLALDAYFPQISGVKDRKKVVLADISISAVWAFLWFVGFCFLANQWQVTNPDDNLLNEGADAARAAITFSFFSIFTWAGQAFLAFQRYKLGASSSLFSQNYTDPNEEAAAHSEGMEYTGYTEDTEEPGSVHPNYDGSTGYQGHEY
ncbi:Synaptogyrin-1 [Bagarius yarrelli]|uniref:Synaptogyrin n=1 Tax=Bagarius yarrelli TaxID=175774 RepID=A0A556TUU1_BAGYA|nr:Synaptogyrin-1 [Bagarius yarrelli]